MNFVGVFKRIATSTVVKDSLHIAIVLEAFFIALAPTVAVACLGIGMVAFLIKWWKDPEFQLKGTPYNWAIAIFMVCGGASIFVSPDRMYSLSIWFVMLLIYFFTYVLVSQNVNTPRHMRDIAYALGTAAAIVILYGFFQFFFGIDTSEMRWVDGEAFPELRKRVFSTLENPNILAAYLDVVACVLLGLFSRLQDRRTRIWLAIGIICCMACLAMTYARGACLTIAVIMAGYGAVKDRRILVAVLVVAAGILVLNPVLLERMTTMFSVGDTSSEMRIAMWESTLQMIMDHPVLGIGGGAYSLVYPIYDTYIVDGSVTLVHAHNIYLNYVAEIGIMGGMGFTIFLFGTMITALFSKKEMPDDFFGGLMVGLGLALISVALNGLTDDVLYNLPSSMLLWMMCGMVVALEENI